METSVYRFIFRHSLRQQILLLILTLLSFPFLYASLDLPKRIVNNAIGGKNIPPDILGYPVDQVAYLMLLSGAFLVLVLVNGWFKYKINTYKGRLGERMLRRLRYELYARILRFPLPRFRRVSSGELIPMITAEVEPLGGFIGDALAVPVFQGGTLVVYIAFIFMQDPILGGAAVALYPFQGWLIPRLQRTVNQLGKQRVRAMRQISDRIGETVSGAQEIHAHGTAPWHLADISSRLGDVYDIRFEIYQRKFFIKFLNNFINQLTPFFFYAIGGYLVIRGSLSFGALVAVLAAYKDLAAPWKELLDWYQQKEDNRIKYEQVVEQFHLPDLLDETLVAAPPEPGAPPAGEPAPRLDGTLTFSGVTLADDGATPVLEGVNATIALDGHTAITGSGTGRDEMAQLIARLLLPSGGQIRWNGQDYTRLPESVTGRRIAYVGPQPHLFAASLYENLIYGLRRPPAVPAEEPDDPRARRRRFESLAAGNTVLEPAGDWIDFAAAGCDGPQMLEERVTGLLAAVHLDDDVYGMGLNHTIDPDLRPDIAARVLAAREAAEGLLSENPKLGRLVERFDPERFNTNASVAENLLFGTPVGPTFAIDALAANDYVLHVLEKAGLTQGFLEAGHRVAETMVELFSGLPPGHEFFERFSFISFADLPAFQAILGQVGKDGLGSLSGESRTRLMALPFRLVQARHRLGLLTPEKEARLLEARRLFARDLPADLRPAVEFFDPRRYNAAASIQDNILFGKLVYGQPQAQAKVSAMMAEVVERLDLRGSIIAVGLNHPVGIAGSRLSGAQRQKVAIARALLKNPDLLVLSEATAGLDPRTQARIHATIREERRGRGLVWVLHQPALAQSFDHVLVMKSGRIVEHGTYDTLNNDGTLFHELMRAD
ncbi:ABC-type multidrug transport system fused ATPase/permease subunit [Azospirillum fermentarium]|uniref:ABC transporter transmembrane domain-containing protein n=1 Tax=Azospirillum fermentarium TaxID=1233114 RepID=UPI0022269570|nr:ABC transporter transmembrane domain-containing protein [Azospirillum fermentarium]MCW2244968.1 ABC-type multidrug transport system fused ATPase/permease subunit [Azospirillum fermentarium]